MPIDPVTVVFVAPWGASLSATSPSRAPAHNPSLSSLTLLIFCRSMGTPLLQSWFPMSRIGNQRSHMRISLSIGDCSDLRGRCHGLRESSAGQRGECRFRIRASATARESTGRVQQRGKAYGEVVGE